MKLDHTKQKDTAIAIMKHMDIYAPYIFGGYWADQEPELYEKMKAIEKKYNCLVYAITHEWLEFGECYSFLIVTAYPEEWATLVHSNGNEHTAFAYVWNKDDDWCSEFGTVVVQIFGGGIRRIG